MNSESKFLQWGLVLCISASVSACAGVERSSHVYSDTIKLNDVKKSDDCYDAAVLLGRNLSDSRELAKKALTAIDSTINEESETQIKAQRNRYIGVFVGSGGEELLVTLKTISGDKTFVTVATKTGFVGGAGQKAWSCRIADEMVAMASR